MLCFATVHPRGYGEHDSGNKATPAEITKFFSELISEHEKTHSADFKKALLSGYTDTFANQIRDMLRNRKMSDITNRDEEYKIKRSIIDSYYSEIEQRSTDAIQRESDALYARYINQISQTPQERLQRLHATVELCDKYKSDSHFIKNLNELYNDDVVMLYADMTAIKLFSQLNDGSMLRDNKSYQVDSNMTRNRYKLSALVDELDPTPVALLSTTQQAIVTNAANVEFEELAQLADIGITAKTNTTTLTKVYKRNTTTFEPYSMICLQDSNGVKGKLIKAKNRLKEAFSAQYGVDLSDECQGSWWLVPADCDKNELLRNII